VLAADSAPPLFGPPDQKLPEAAKFRLGRSTSYTTGILAFSADGKTVATFTNIHFTAGLDAPVDLWNVETGAHVATLRHHKTGVMAAAFSPDGSVVATSGVDNRLRFWDARTGKDITNAEHINLTGHGYNLCFSPDGKRLLVGSTKLEMYDAKTQQPLKAKEGYFAETANSEFFHTALWSPKGKYVIAGCDGAGLRVWDADTGTLLYKLSERYTIHRTRFAFSPDDNLLLLSVWPDGVFKVLDAATGKEQHAVKKPADEAVPERVEFAREMGRVAWVVQKAQYQPGQTIAVSDATGQELKRFDVPGIVASHLLSNDGQRLAVGGPDGSLRIYATDTGKLERTLLGAWSAVFRSVYVDGGKVLRTVHRNGLVHDFDAGTGKHLKERTLKLDQSKYLIALSADGNLLASATEAGACTIWDLTTGAEKAKPKGKLFGHREPAFGPPGPFPLPPGPGPQPPGVVPAVLPAGTLPALPPGGPRAAPPQPLQPPPDPPQFVAAFSADGKLLAAVIGDDDTVSVCDTATGAEKFAVKVAKGIGAVALSAEGTHLFTGQARTATKAKNAGYVRLFELKSGKEMQRWHSQLGEKHKNLQFVRTDVVELHLSPDQETLLVVEAQVYHPLPPPPIPAGGRVPEQRATQVRVISLSGRAKDWVLPADGHLGQIDFASDGNSVGFLTADVTDVNKPLLVVKVLDVATGKVKTGTVATGYRSSLDDNGYSAAFRPSSTDLAVRSGDGAVLVIDAAKLTGAK
jgi:WD40 repeat protein